MGSGFHFFFPGSHFGVQNLNPKMGSAFESFFFTFRISLVAPMLHPQAGAIVYNCCGPASCDSLSWAARRLETCLKTFTRKPPVKFRQQMPANRPWWLTPFWGPNFGPQNGVRLSFFLSGFPFWGPKFEPQNGVSL